MLSQEHVLLGKITVPNREHLHVLLTSLNYILYFETLLVSHFLFINLFFTDFPTVSLSLTPISLSLRLRVHLGFAATRSRRTHMPAQGPQPSASLISSFCSRPLLKAMTEWVHHRLLHVTPPRTRQNSFWIPLLVSPVITVMQHCTISGWKRKHNKRPKRNGWIDGTTRPSNPSSKPFKWNAFRWTSVDPRS